MKEATDGVDPKNMIETIRSPLTIGREQTKNVFAAIRRPQSRVTIRLALAARIQASAAFDDLQQRESITSSSTLVATCTNVGGTQFTWAINGQILQFVDCK